MLNISGASRTTYLFLTLCYFGTYLVLLSGNIVNVGSSTMERILWDLAHIPLYAGLAILLCLHLGNTARRGAGFFRSVWKPVFIALSIAVLDEWSQLFIDGRRASLLDFSLDSVGIIIALWVMYRVSAQGVDEELLESQER